MTQNKCCEQVCNAQCRHPWTMAENSTQWLHWPCPIPQCPSKQLKASVHDNYYILCCVSCSIYNLTCHTNWKRLPQHAKYAKSVHATVLEGWLVRPCPAKTNVWALLSYTIPNLPGTTGDEAYKATKILNFLVWLLTWSEGPTSLKGMYKLLAS